MADDDDVIWMADEDLEIEGDDGVIIGDSDDEMEMRSDEEKLSEAKMKEEEELAGQSCPWKRFIPYGTHLPRL